MYCRIQQSKGILGKIGVLSVVRPRWHNAGVLTKIPGVPMVIVGTPALFIVELLTGNCHGMAILNVRVSLLWLQFLKE